MSINSIKKYIAIIGMSCFFGFFSTTYAASVIFPYQGGTGTSTVPVIGQVLVGQSNGTYAPQATSSLGISGGGGGGTPGGSNGQLQYNNAGSFAGTSSPIVGYITATSITSTSTFAGPTSLNTATIVKYPFLIKGNSTLSGEDSYDLYSSSTPDAIDSLGVAQFKMPNIDFGLNRSIYDNDQKSNLSIIRDESNPGGTAPWLFNADNFALYAEGKWPATSTLISNTSDFGHVPQNSAIFQGVGYGDTTLEADSYGGMINDIAALSLGDPTYPNIFATNIVNIDAVGAKNYSIPLSITTGGVPVNGAIMPVYGYNATTSTSNLLYDLEGPYDTPFAGQKVTAGGQYANLGISGNIGIGTFSPIYPLEIIQNTSTDLVAWEQNEYAGKGAYYILNANSNYVSYNMLSPTQSWNMGQFGTTDFMVNDQTNNKNPFAIKSGAPSNTEVLAASGMIGIGTAVPQVHLDVSNSTSAENDIAVRNNLRGAYLGVTNTGVPFINLMDGTGSFTGQLIVGNASTSDLYLGVNGNVGLGMTPGTIPAQKLEMAVGNNILLDSGKIGFAADATNYYLGPVDATNGVLGHSYYGWTFNGNTGTGLHVDSTGNVGIGTTSPVAPLAVNGNAYIAGTITATSTATSTFTGGIIAKCFATSTAGGCITPGTGGSGTNYWTLSGNNLYPNSTSYLVGIGNTAPTALLSLGTAGTNTLPPSTQLWISGKNLGASTTAIQNRISIGTDNNQDYGAYMGEMNMDGALNQVAQFGTRVAGVDYPAINLNQGKVGIGTATPTYTLDFGNTVGRTLAVFDNGASNLYGISMNGAGTGANPFREQFFSNGNEAMDITSSGSVGIGTTTPTGQLYLYGNGGGTNNESETIANSGFGTSSLQLAEGGVVTGQVYTTAGGDFNIASGVTGGTGNTYFFSNGSTKMSILNNGNVGIGTTSPTNRLEVNGNSYLAGNLTTTGTETLTALGSGHPSIIAVDNNGVIIATTTTAGGGVTAVSGTWPIVSSGGATPTISWAGLATSSNLTGGNVIYATGAGTIAGVATGTITCSGTASCGAGSYVLGSNLTITGSGSASGLGTSSPWTVGNLAYVSSSGTVGSVATSSASCSSGVSCTGFTVVGTVSPSITNTGVLSIGGLTGAVATSSLGLVSYGYASSTYYLATNPNGYTTNTGTVTSITLGSPNSTMSLSGTNPITTSGTVNFDLNLAHSNSWTANQSFTSASSSYLTVGNLIATSTISLPSGSVTNAFLANSTISSIALGNNLANLTATDGTLTFSGTYNGSTARTIGLNLGNTNAWTTTGTTTFAGGLSVGGTVSSSTLTVNGTTMLIGTTTVGTLAATTTSAFAVGPSGNTYFYSSLDNSYHYPIFTAGTAAPTSWATSSSPN